MDLSWPTGTDPRVIGSSCKIPRFPNPLNNDLMDVAWAQAAADSKLLGMGYSVKVTEYPDYAEIVYYGPGRTRP